MTLAQRDPRALELRMPTRFLDWLTRWPAHWPELPWGEAELLRVEELREGDTLVIRAEIPGIDPDKDVTISVEGGVLTIDAEKRHEEKTEEKGIYRSEFSYGRFTRSLVLPEGADAEAVKASYKDGILEVRVAMPPVAASEPAKIPVEHG